MDVPSTICNYVPVTPVSAHCPRIPPQFIGQRLRRLVQHVLPIGDGCAVRSRRWRRLCAVGGASDGDHTPELGREEWQRSVRVRRKKDTDEEGTTLLM